MIAAKDLNNDGLVDLVLTNDDTGGYSHYISVLLQNGDYGFDRLGTLDFAEDLGSSWHAYAYEVVIDDMDGNGHNDIIVTRSDTYYDGSHYDHDGVVIFLNSGENTLVLSELFNEVQYFDNISFDDELFYEPYFVRVADFNGDGQLDIVTSNSDATYITVLTRCYCDNIYETATYSTYDYTYALDVADVDNDGDIDILVGTGCDNTHFRTYLNNGDGIFNRDRDPDSKINIGSYISYITTTDFDNDGNRDVLFANGDGVTIIMGNGDGTYASPNNLLFINFASDTTEAVAVGDFNNDGKIDFVAPDSGSNRIGIFENLIFIPAAMNTLLDSNSHLFSISSDFMDSVSSDDDSIITDAVCTELTGDAFYKLSPGEQYMVIQELAAQACCYYVDFNSEEYCSTSPLGAYQDMFNAATNSLCVC